MRAAQVAGLVARRARARVAPAAQRADRRDRDERQDDDGRADRRDPPGRRAAGRGRRQRRRRGAGSLPAPPTPSATIVCEVSSFQLEDTDAFAPEAAVLLNLAPDHLDRHDSYEGYVAAKLRIFANQGTDDLAVLRPSSSWRTSGVRPPGPVRRGTRRGAVRARRLSVVGRGAAGPWHDRAPGLHNRQNAMAAAAVSLARGARRRRRSSTGLATLRWRRAPSRGDRACGWRQLCQRLEGDERREYARRAGGVPRQRPADPRRSRQGPGLHAAARGGRRCRAVYLIGEAARELADALAPAACRCHAGDLEAVRRAGRPPAPARSSC